jgi:hypothetical protein
LPPTITYLGFDSNSSIKDNIPISVDTVKIHFYKNLDINQNVNNLSTSIQKIIVNCELGKKYITKIPFGCKIVKISKNVLEEYDIFEKLHI